VPMGSRGEVRELSFSQRIGGSLDFASYGDGREAWNGC
jgi:hypothetical protein